MALPYFSEAAARFLRGLARHNDRTWFEARRSTYENEVKAPMLTLIEHLNAELSSFAPEHIRPANKAMMRIYRDTRFSADKIPYKTHISAWWSRDGLAKTSGAGFYLRWSPADLTVAAGVYKPEKQQLLAIRGHLVSHHAELSALLRSRAIGAAFGKHLEGAKLSRPPKGFAGAPAEAMPFLLHQQWGISVTLPSEVGMSPTCAGQVAKLLRIAAPLVALLNTPLLKEQQEDEAS